MTKNEAAKADHLFSRPRWCRMQRFAPVLGLLLLAPWVGEYLLGNIPLGAFLALPFLVPLYGGGALLIREVARRTGRGWPTILLLAAAYGVIEAGLVDQSLFNPTFEGHDFQAVTPIPGLGISAYNAMSFIIGHAVWSIGIPIAIVEMLTPKRRTTPWLGSKGLAVVVVLYLLGCWIIFQDLLTREEFLDSSAQLTGAALTACALIVLAFVIKKKRAAVATRPAPNPWLVGLATLILANAFFLRPENWVGVILGMALLCVAVLVVLPWSRRPAWGVRHEFALVAGAMPTYALAGFVLTYLIRPDDTVAWMGNVVFALIAGVLLIVTAKRIHRTG
jgi:hypothetical protein